MEHIDLDIDNYSLDDILNLFKLKHNFTKEDLKQAKKQVLKTHPDKSKLDRKYFLFFTKAYKIVFKIYEFRNQNEERSSTYISTTYAVDKDETKEKELEKIIKKENFNEWFNELFEKTQLSDLNNSTGYGDWLKSDDDCYQHEAQNMTEMNNEIENRKTAIRELVPFQDISDMNSNGGFSILESESGFESDVFSNLQYEDLKKAHVESVIPVTHEDYANKPKFRNVNEMQNFRSRQDTKPLSLKQSEIYLEQKDNNEAEVSTKRAFQLAKEYEVNKEKNKVWWSHIRQIAQ
jgi:hypothetical protein